MPAIYVIDEPETRSLVTNSRGDPARRVVDLGNGYFRVESDGELVFDRKTLGFKPAVWYSAFAGGLEGRIVQFDRETVRVTD